VKTALSSRRLPLWLALLAFVLSFPALGIGWQMDDHFHRLVMLEETEGDLSPGKAFSALDGDGGLNHHYREMGYLPWWTPDDFRLALFRPLAIATTWLDYQLWPNSPALMHVQSLFWFAALIAAATLLFRRFLEPAWLGGLAALLYALDDAHASPAAWLANRNALLATLFGVLCLVAHDRWRRDGWKPGAWTAPTLLGLGLASGELALATTAYLFSYALFVEPDKRRLRSLSPHAVVVTVWAGVYLWGGYGASGSGLYIDPLRNPTAYAQALMERAPFLLMGQWTPLPAELGSLLPPAASRPWWIVAVVLTAVLLAALLPILQRDRIARFWGLGMLISLLPISATFTSNRLLIFVGLGAMGLLAGFLEQALGHKPSAGSLGPRLRRGLAWGLVATHFVLAPILLFLGPLGIRTLGEPMLTAATSLGSDPRIADQDLIVTNTPDYLMFVTNLPTLQALNGRPVPRRILALSSGPTSLELERTDERTLRVTLERGLFSGPLGRLFHETSQPFEVGQRIDLAGSEIQILSLTGTESDGSPGMLLYRFQNPLEDPSMRWVRWQDGRYVAFAPPALGEIISLPAAIGPLDRFGWESQELSEPPR
jgi:hypothetical protein